MENLLLALEPTISGAVVALVTLKLASAVEQSQLSIGDR